MNRPDLLRGALLVVMLLATGLAMPGASMAGLVETGSWGKHIERPDFQVRAVVYDSQGRAFIAETGKSRIVRLETDGELDLNWSVGPRPQDKYLRNPVDLAIDGSDNLYALDQIESKVRKYSTDGSLLGEWQVVIHNGKVQGITFEGGSVWVISDDKVRRYSPTGTLQDSWAGFDTYQDWIEPQIRGDGTGHLLVTSGRWTDEFEADKTLYRFDLDGNQVSAWTSEAPAKTNYFYDGYESWVTELEDIDGFDAVAPLGAGDPWTSAGARITKYGSSGPVGDSIDFDRKRFPNSLALDPEGNLLYSWDNGDDAYWKSSGLAMLNPELEPVRDWSEFDFPKYADRKWEGYFRTTDGLTARSDGVVGIYDDALRRVQLFDSDGNFVRFIEAPRFEEGQPEPMVLLPDSGGAEFFNWKSGELVRLDQNGDLIGEVSIEVPGRVNDITLLPGGGYAVVSIRPNRIGRISTFDRGGVLKSSFEVSIDQHPGAGEISAVEPLGRSILVMDRVSITRYSRSGEREAAWFLPLAKCERVGSVDALAVDFKGNVYVAFNGIGAKLIRLSGSLVRKWEEPIPEFGPDQKTGNDLDVGPGGIYLGVYRRGIHRFDQSKAKAKPRYGSCRKPLRLVGIETKRSGRSAVAVVSTNSDGVLTLSGPGVKTVERKIKERGIYRLDVRPKPKFARTGSGDSFRFPFTITYEDRVTSKIRSAVRLRTGR